MASDFAVNAISGGPTRGPTPGDVAQAVNDAINNYVNNGGQAAFISTLGQSSGQVLINSALAGGSGATGDVSTGILSTEILNPGVGRRDYPLVGNNMYEPYAFPTRQPQLSDLNNDGALDVIQPYSDGWGTFFGVYLNQGDGTFGQKSAYSLTGLGAAYRGVLTADLNGDRLMDMIVCGVAGNNMMAVRLNQGNGIFGPQTNLTLASSAAGSAALGDVNGDGRIDIVQASGSGTSSRANVFLNQGNGSFAPSATYALPNSVQLSAGLSLGDLDGDGRLDLVAPISSLSRLVVALNAGSGTFGAGVTYAVGSVLQTTPSLGDLNGDGKLDIVQTNTGSVGGSAETVSVLLNSGSGTFGTKTDYTVGDSPRGAATLADLNGDGRLDIVQSNNNSDTVSVLLNNGSGIFGTKTDYAVGDQPTSSATVVDVNSDGYGDIVQRSVGAGVSVLLNNGFGSFGARSDYAVSSISPFESASVADLNGDGLAEIVVPSSQNYNAFTVLTNQGAGSFASSTLSAKLTFSDARGTAKIQHVDLTTAASAREAMDTLEARAEKISRQRAVYGSVESRLKAAASVIDSTIINYRSAESRIKDTDVAEDAASMMRLNILKQVGASVLAQANLEPQIALRLLQGA